MNSMGGIAGNTVGNNQFSGVPSIDTCIFKNCVFDYNGHKPGIGDAVNSYSSGGNYIYRGNRMHLWEAFYHNRGNINSTYSNTDYIYG